jgi:hypothetical protein
MNIHVQNIDIIFDNINEAEDLLMDRFKNINAIFN